MLKTGSMRVALLVLNSFITLTALPAGMLMMLEPNGSSLGLSLSLLLNTPFPDFFIPGLLLALIVGGCSLVSLFLIMNHSPAPYKIAMASGVALMIWIVTELILIPYYHWLQGLYLAIGILIALTSYQLMGKAAI